MTHFIQEFHKLLLEKPRYNLKHVNSDENCDYADTIINSKDCYYSFGTFHSESLMYSRYSRDCNHCSDLTFCFKCEWCYGLVGCNGCYNCDNSEYLDNCSVCSYSMDLVGCRNCFGCVGLHQKEYHVFNEKLTKDAYEKQIAELDLNNPAHVDAVKAKVESLRQSVPQRYSHITSSENSTGDNLIQTQNAHLCYDSYDVEDCGYCVETNSLKNCYDMTVCFKTEESYMCSQCPQNYNLNFCIHTDNSSDSEFLAYSANMRNCFGCVYMKDKQYCILNEQYSKEDYEKKIVEIKRKLYASGHYNLNPFFVSDYEQGRLQNEPDPLIPVSLPVF
ncbi:hypothetical protein COY07_06295 [Candidatus Peregrinibacteria bacterium CG_4_10_14_0_2_um_filter_43_11]|nr:MAG: hypothetical protein COY07_06295 [Candidatus Peregrinibacteria bacterium CG_4_10_14_0_2_um_filter_43_11]